MMAPANRQKVIDSDERNIKKITAEAIMIIIVAIFFEF